MSDFISLLQEAQKRKARELWLIPESEVRLRVGVNWRKLESLVVSSNEIQRWVDAILNEVQKNELRTDNYTQGNLEIKNKRVKFLCFIDCVGTHLIFQWMNIEYLDSKIWDFPQFMYQSLNKSPGLSLIIGERQSGKSTVIEVIKEELNKNSSIKPALLFVRDSEDIFQNPNDMGLDLKQRNLSIEMSFDVLKKQNYRFSFSADYIFIDSKNKEAIKAAVTLVQMGYRVITSVTAPNIKNSVLEYQEIASFLNFVLFIKLIPGLETPLVPVYELILGTDEVRDALSISNWKAVKEIITTQGENSGMRSLNQSLVQNLLKRKIDWKVGFEESPSPEELDQLLKRIGI